MSDSQNQKSKLFRDSCQDVRPSTIRSSCRGGRKKDEELSGRLLLHHLPTQLPSPPLWGPLPSLSSNKGLCEPLCSVQLPVPPLSPEAMWEGRGGNSGLERLKGSLWCVLCLGGSSVLPLTLWALQAPHFPPTPHVQSSVLALCFTDFRTSPQCRHNTPATSWKSVKQTEPEEAQLLHPGLGAESQARTFHSFLSLLSWIPQWKHEVCSFYTNENFTQTGKKNTSFQYPEFKAIRMLYRSFTDSDTSKPSKAGIWMMNTICRGLDSAEEIRPYHHYTHPFHLQLLRTPDKSGPSCSGWSTKHIHPIKIQPIKTTFGDKEHVPLVTKKIKKIKNNQNSQSAEFPHNKFVHKNTRTTGNTTYEREIRWLLENKEDMQWATEAKLIFSQVPFLFKDSKHP